MRARIPTVSLVVSIVVVCLGLLRPALGANGTIGLYSDSNGYSCSFSGDNSGPVTTYVVIKPGSSGLRGARFSAPIPSCFHAVYAGDVTPPGIVSFGDSQSGISVSSGACETDPFQVLQVTYLANGGTTSCCQFEIVADPFTGILEATNCSFQSSTITSIVSRFNADASCACGTTPPTYQPPSAPSNPLPADQAAYVPVETQLRWSCFDPQDLGLTSDVYFGADSNPPMLEANVPSGNLTTYTPGHLQNATTYFWRIVVRNSAQLESSGPVWSFTTTPNAPPLFFNLSPSDGAIKVPVTPLLRWNALDPDGDIMTFDVYIGTSASPPLAVAGLPTRTYTPASPLAFATRYYWRVEARDSHNNTKSSETLSFTTRAASEPPTIPASPVPSDAATGVALNPTLTWTCSDPEGQALTYDVYFGQKSPAPGTPTVGLYTDANGSSCSLSATSGGLMNVYVVIKPGSVPLREVGFMVSTPPCFNAVYVAEDFNFAQGFAYSGNSQTGMRISRLAQSCISSPVGPLKITYLSNGATPCCAFPLQAHPDFGHVRAVGCSGTETSINVVTTHLDADATCACEDVYQLPRVAYNITQKTYVPGALQMHTAYQWRIVARDTEGYETSGPFWSFTTLGGEVPVAFQAFDAKQNGAGADIRWQLESDEVMESFTLYRREGSGSASAITQGSVQSASGSYFDAGVETGKTYRYELLVRASSGSEFRSQAATVTIRALELALHQNQPNPFNPQTTIRYDLPPGSTRVRLLIADATGRRVRTLVDETQTAGTRSVTWNGRDDAGNAVSSGVYFYMLDAGKDRLTRKLVLLK